MYYIMKCPVYTNEKGELLNQIENTEDVGEIWSWGDGIAFNEEEKKSIPTPIQMDVSFYNDYKGLPTEYDDINTCVMSERLADAIKNAGVDNIELYPVILTDKETQQEYSYFAYNIIGVITAVHYKKSNIEAYDKLLKTDLSIHNLVMDESNINGLLIFRLAENTNTIFVHESVKKSIETAGIDTVIFYKAEDYMHL